MAISIFYLPNVFSDHVFNPPKRLQEENKTQGSNTIMSTSFALEVWSSKNGYFASSVEDH